MVGLKQGKEKGGSGGVEEGEEGEREYEEERGGLDLSGTYEG